MSRSHRTPDVLRVVVLLFFGLTIPVHANLYHVDSAQGMDTNDGSTWGDAFETLQKALAVAAMIPGPHMIRVAAAGPGKAGATTYRPDEGPATPFERGESFMILPKTILIGGFLNGGTVSDPENNITILSGDLAGNDGPGFMGYDENSLHVLRFVENPLAPGDNPQTIVDGFTITGGNANQFVGCLDVGNIHNSAGGGAVLDGGALGGPQEPLLHADRPLGSMSSLRACRSSKSRARTCRCVPGRR